MGCWRGYLSGARCRLAYVPADATANRYLCFSKIQICFTFLVPAHLGSPGKGPLNGCECARIVWGVGSVYLSDVRLSVCPIWLPISIVAQPSFSSSMSQPHVPVLCCQLTREPEHRFVLLLYNGCYNAVAKCGRADSVALLC